MMGRSHAISGLAVGVLAAGAIPHAPLPVRLLIIPVMGGASLLPDLDHPQGTAARSLGLVTKLIARLVNELSLSIYHATRGPGDPRGRRDGHRLLSHTLPGCLAVGIPMVLTHTIGRDLAGSLVSDPVWAARIPAILTTIMLGINFGLLARTSASIGTLFTVVGTGLSWWVVVGYPAWWWVWPTAVVLGCVTHVLGDGCTVAGVPILWPIPVQTSRGPARWRMYAFPGAFETGKHVEKELIVPALCGSVVFAVGLVTGILPALLSVAWRVVDG